LWLAAQWRIEMPKDDAVTDADFTNVPRGGTQDTFDDHLSDLDGTDAADNLSILPPKGKDLSFPSREEFNATGDGEDKPVAHKTDDEDESGDEKVAVVEEKADEDVVFENETQLVESLGFKDVPTVAALVEKIRGEGQSEVDGIKSFFAAAGINLYGRTMQELNRELQGFNPAVLRTDNGAGTGKGKTKATDESFPSADELLTEAFAEDPNSKKFYQRYGKAIAGPLQAKVDELNGQMEALSNDRMVNDYVADKALYDMAVAATSKDDGPIPSFGEARRLLQANPRARAEALYRMMNFGNEKDTPFLAVFGQWRAQTNQLGLTNAQVALKRDAGKVAKFNKQGGAGKGPDNLKPRKQDEAAAIAATRKLPVSVLERGR